MLPQLGQRLDQAARGFVPVISMFLFLLAGAIIWPMPFVGALSPSFGFVALFYWTVHRPDLLRPLAIFALGIVHDALSYWDFGLSALLFVGAYQLILSQRRYFVGQPFPVLWVGFSLVMLLFTLVSWVFLSLAHSAFVPLGPVLAQAILTIILFPIPAWLLIKLQRVLLTQG